MASKYDYAKIKVVLKEENYFILSRFLLSKMLLFCQVPANVAVRVSLEVKKHFVDAGLTTISDQQLRDELFVTLRRHGCGDQYIQLFHRFSEFQAARVPLVVFVAGASCTGKSAVAQLLGSKLSNFHVINTDLVLETIDVIDAMDEIGPPFTSTKFCGGSLSCDATLPAQDARLASCRVSPSGYGVGDANLTAPERSCSIKSGENGRSVWTLEASEPADFLELWKSRCLRVAACVDGEVQRALAEGKTLIIEGSCIDLCLFRQYIDPVLLKDACARALASRKTRSTHAPTGEALSSTLQRSKKVASGQPIVLACLLKVPSEEMPESVFVYEHWLRDRHTAAPGRTSHLELQNIRARCRQVEDYLTRSLLDVSLADRVTIESIGTKTIPDIASALHEQLLERIVLALDAQRIAAE